MRSHVSSRDFTSTNNLISNIDLIMNIMTISHRAVRDYDFHNDPRVLKSIDDLKHRDLWVARCAEDRHARRLAELDEAQHTRFMTIEQHMSARQRSYPYRITPPRSNHIVARIVRWIGGLL